MSSKSKTEEFKLRDTIRKFLTRNRDKLQTSIFDGLEMLTRDSSRELYNQYLFRLKNQRIVSRVLKREDKKENKTKEKKEKTQKKREENKQQRQIERDALLQERLNLFSQLESENKPYKRLSIAKAKTTLPKLRVENKLLQELIERQEASKIVRKNYRIVHNFYTEYAGLISNKTRAKLYKFLNNRLVEIDNNEAIKLRSERIPVYNQYTDITSSEHFNDVDSNIENYRGNAIYIKDEDDDVFIKYQQLFPGDEWNEYSSRVHSVMVVSSILTIDAVYQELDAIEVPEDLLQEQVNMESVSCAQLPVITSEFIQIPYEYSPDLKLSDIFTLRPSSEYLQNNFKPYACAHSAIIDRFKSIFDKRYKDELTYEFLDRLFDTTPENRGVSVNTIISKWSEKYNVSTVIQDIRGNIVRYYEKKGNNRLYDTCLYMIVHNRHFYLYNNNINSLRQILSSKKEEQKQEEDDKEEEESHDAYKSKFTISGNNKKITLLCPSFFEDFAKINFERFDNETRSILNKLNINKLPELNNFKKLLKSNKIKLSKTEIEKIYEAEKPRKYDIYVDDPLDDVLQFLFKCGYIPNIKTSFNQLVSRIDVMINGHQVSLKNPERDMFYETLDFKGNVQQFDEYNRLNNALKNSFGGLKSYYPKNWVDISSKCAATAVLGRVSEQIPNTYIDSVKCYSSCLNEMETIPIINYSDVWCKPSFPLSIQSNYFYLLKRVKQSEDVAINSILLKDDYTIFRGDELLQIYNLIKENVSIIALSQMSRTSSNKLSKQIQEIYNNQILNESQKKFMINSVTGMIEKVKNNTQITQIFRYEDEANYFRNNYNNSRINLVDDIKTMGQTMYYPEEQLRNYSKFYLFSARESTDLNEGYLPIKLAIYSMYRLKMFNKCKEVINQGGEITGIRADCIECYFQNKPAQTITTKTNELYNTLGTWKIKHINSEQYKKIRNKMDFHKRQDLELEIYEQKDADLVTLKNEPTYDQIQTCDKEDINKKYFQEATEVVKGFKNENKDIIIKGLYPGSGKTYLASEVLKSISNNYFVITYTNKRCYELIHVNGLDKELVATFHKSLKLRKGKEDVNYSLFKNIDCLFIDEIYSFSISMLRELDYIKRFINTQLFVIAAGDSFQSRINTGINVKNEREYYEFALNQMFQNGILLQHNKRMDQENTNQLKQIQTIISSGPFDYKDLGIKVFTDEKDLYEKHFKEGKFIGHVLAYYRQSRYMLNKLLHDYYRKLSPKGWVNIENKYYRVGQKIICHSSENLHDIEDKTNKLHTNFEYIITDINVERALITLRNVYYEYYTIQFHKLKHFDYEYCNTILSTQGDTYKNVPVSICDIDSYFMSIPENLNVAISRANKIGNNSFFVLNKLQLNTSHLHSRIEKKIRGYKQQDFYAGREFEEEDYITRDWVVEKLFDYGLVCPMCNITMGWDDSNISTSFVVDRVHNSLAHIASNCQIICHNCNSKKR